MPIATRLITQQILQLMHIYLLLTQLARFAMKTMTKLIVQINYNHVWLRKVHNTKKINILKSAVSVIMMATTSDFAHKLHHVNNVVRHTIHLLNVHYIYRNVRNPLFAVFVNQLIMT